VRDGLDGKRLVEFVFGQRRAKPFFLPKYSPDLNPIEMLWPERRVSRPRPTS